MRRFLGLCADGLPFVMALASFAVVALVLGNTWIFLALALITLSVAWFFRDPRRSVPKEPGLLVSPADGRVIDVRNAPVPHFLSGEATRISIFMSVFNVHVNRTPCQGRVENLRHHRGRFFGAYADKASLHNEQNAILLRTESGRPLVFVQIAGFIARRIVCRLKVDECVARGERFGLIRFGSRVDVYVPTDVRVEVSAGGRVRAGETVLGRMP